MEHKHGHTNPTLVYGVEGTSSATQGSHNTYPGPYQNQVPTVIQQPTVSGVYIQEEQLHMTRVTQVPDYCALSALVCFFCCWPLGLCGLIKANEARVLAAQGRIAEAQEASNQAKCLSMTGLIIGLILVVIIVIIICIATI